MGGFELSMELNSGAGIASPETQDVVINLALLRRILRQRRPMLLAVGIGVFAVSLIAMACLLPQSFTSSTSLSLQQPTATGSGLSSLLGLGAGNNARYLGILRSRRLAMEVESHVHLREFYHFGTMKKTLDKIQTSVKPENSATDGLLYIRVSLSGPARFGPGAAQKRQLVEAKAAETANAYADALRNYMRFSDTDKDAVLLREAENKLRQARQDYDASTQLLANFVRGNRIAPGGGASSNQSPGSPTALTELNALYVRRGTLATEITSAETGRKGTTGLLGNGEHIHLPAEDPLLADARANARDAELNLKNLRVAFGEDNPKVVRAREELKNAQAELAAQAQSIRTGQTTDTVKLDRLRAEYAEVNRQIVAAEQDFKTGRNAGTQYELLRNEVELRLAALKEFMTHYAELKLQTVAAQNRLSVMDPAIPADTGMPSLSYMAIFSLFIALLVVIVWVARLYFALVAATGGAGNGFSPNLDMTQTEGKEPLIR